jgi:hypothetical protein
MKGNMPEMPKNNSKKATHHGISRLNIPALLIPPIQNDKEMSDYLNLTLEIRNWSKPFSELPNKIWIAEKGQPCYPIRYGHLGLDTLEVRAPWICALANSTNGIYLFHKDFVEKLVSNNIKLPTGDKFRKVTIVAKENNNYNDEYYLYEGSRILESKFGTGFEPQERENSSLWTPNNLHISKDIQTIRPSFFTYKFLCSCSIFHE